MKRLIYIIATLCFAGCAVAPPQVRQTVVPETFIFARSGDTVAVAAVEWWEIFGDTTLNRLIATAIENNTDLAVAASRVEQAKMQLDVTRSAFLPQVGVSVAAEGVYSESAVTGRKSISQQYSVLPSVSWEVSLFGTLKHSTAAAQAKILATDWGYRAAVLSLAAQVAETYFQWLQYARSLEISERSYALREEAQQKIDTMFYYGFSSAVDMQQARSLTATAAADIPAYRRAMIQTNLVLNTLLGEEPNLLPEPPHPDYMLPCEEALEGLRCEHLTTASLPDYVPSGLPSALLERRPDVLEAFYNAEAAAAETQLARAERFPSIAITGEGGVLAYTVKGLTAHNPFYWLAEGSITQPIFAFGKLKRNEQIAVENWRQAMLAYRQSMIQALSDVESAMAAIQTYSTQSRRYITLLDANRKIQHMTSALYADGLSDYLDVIDAERNLYSSQLEYIQILTDQLTAYVTLYKALGGGW